MSMTEFLASARKNQLKDYESQKFNFLQSHAADIPVIEKLEFRTETNEFDPRKQEYLVRVSPNSKKKIRTQRQYQETIRHLSEMELKQSLDRAIRLRYDLMVNFLSSLSTLASRREMKVLHDDKVTLLKRSISLPNFDVLELIEAENDAQKNEHEILDLENILATLQQTMQRVHQKNMVLDLNQSTVIEVESIRAILNDLPPTTMAQHPELEVRSAKLYSNVLAHDWEVAQNNFSVGYVQAKYGGTDPDENFRKAFSVGVGFDIPLNNRAPLNVNEKQIALFESKLDYSNTKNKIIEEKHTLFYHLQNLFKKYDLIRDNLQDSQAEFALREYSKIAEASPNALLKLRENTLEQEQTLQQLKYLIMQSFIEYLDLSGAITQLPLRNYLSENLETF